MINKFVVPLSNSVSRRINMAVKRLLKHISSITESVRRARRHEEYTSITDAIDLDELPQLDKVSSMFCLVFQKIRIKLY